MEEADPESFRKILTTILTTIIIYNRTGNVLVLLCDFSDQLREDLSRDLGEYDVSVEPEAFINSVFVLMEKEPESMDASPLQIESTMVDIGLTDAQRSDINELFETIEKAKQETHWMDIFKTLIRTWYSNFFNGNSQVRL